MPGRGHEHHPVFVCLCRPNVAHPKVQVPSTLEGENIVLPVKALDSQCLRAVEQYLLDLAGRFPSGRVHWRFPHLSPPTEIPLTDVDPVIYVRARDSDQSSVGLTLTLQTSSVRFNLWENCRDPA